MYMPRPPSPSRVRAPLTIPFGNKDKRSCFEIDIVTMTTVKFFDNQNLFVSVTVSYFRTRTPSHTCVHSFNTSKNRNI